MTTLSPDAWTVVAHRVRSGPVHHWQWEPGVGVKHLQAQSEADAVVLMHRRTPTGVELVARIAGPAWRRMRVSIRERRGRWA